MDLLRIDAPSVLRKPSVVALLVANVVPLFGVLALNWDLGVVLLVFWLESAFLGLYTIVKIIIVGRVAAFFFVPFFTVHFGMFMMGHLMFIVLLFLGGGILQGGGPRLATLQENMIGIGMAALAVGISHTVSFVQNFAKLPEKIRPSPAQLMAIPYKRIVVMHLTIILGGFVVLLLGQPVVALLFLVVLKTSIDLASHVHEHKAESKGWIRVDEPAKGFE